MDKRNMKMDSNVADNDIMKSSGWKWKLGKLRLEVRNIF